MIVRETRLTLAVRLWPLVEEIAVERPTPVFGRICSFCLTCLVAGVIVFEISSVRIRTAKVKNCLRQGGEAGIRGELRQAFDVLRPDLLFSTRMNAPLTRKVVSEDIKEIVRRDSVTYALCGLIRRV